MKASSSAMASPGADQQRERYLPALLALTGAILLVLFLSYVIVMVNYPEDQATPLGISRPSVSLFARLWTYPDLVLSRTDFRSIALPVTAALWMVYVYSEAVLRRAQATSTRRRMAAVIAGFALLFSIVLLLVMPPVLSSDIFLYALFGRMAAMYHLNPFTTTAQALTNDSLFPYVYWQNVTSYYGPVWTLISAAAAALAGHDVLLTTLAFKAVGGMFNLVNCVLVFVLARRLTGGDGLAALLLYAWNPLILIESVGSGHNDVVMVTFALASLLLLVDGRVLAGVAVLVASVLVKFLSGILLLFVVVTVLIRQTSRRAALALAAGMAAAGAIVLVAAYLPFWSGLRNPGQLIGAGGALRAVASNPLRVGMREIVGIILTGGGPVTQQARDAAEGYLVPALNAVFVVIILYAVYRLARDRSDLAHVVQTWGVVSLIYIVLIYGGVFPWYMVSVLTIPLIGPDSRVNRLLLLATVAVGFIFMLFYAIPVPVPMVAASP